MFKNVVVGFDGSEQARDALALASVLRAEDGVVTAVCVMPDPELPFGGNWGEAMEDAAADTLSQATADADGAGWLRLSALSATSAARGLHDFAVKHEADLTVVGSSHRGHAGRTLAGTVAQTLLSGASCPIAVAPRGYRDEEGPLESVGVAFNGSPEAGIALHMAMEIAEGTGAAVRPICVVPTVEFWTGEAGWYRDLTEDERVSYRRYELKRMVDDASVPLPADLRERVTVVEGPPGMALVHATENLDLLIMGSRGYGPVRRVLLGGASGVVVREAHGPVIVVPRGVESDLEGSTQAARAEQANVK